MRQPPRISTICTPLLTYGYSLLFALLMVMWTIYPWSKGLTWCPEKHTLWIFEPKISSKRAKKIMIFVEKMEGQTGPPDRDLGKSSKKLLILPGIASWSGKEIGPHWLTIGPKLFQDLTITQITFFAAWSNHNFASFRAGVRPSRR